MSQPDLPGTADEGGRRASLSRTTKETAIDLSLDLDGTGVVDVATGLPFFDHMLDQIGRHGGFDLTLRAEGDLHVDGHHTIEDVGIVLGQAIRQALGDSCAVGRMGHGLVAWSKGHRAPRGAGSG